MVRNLLLCVTLSFAAVSLATHCTGFAVHSRTDRSSNTLLLRGHKDEIGVGIDLGTTYSAIAYLKDGIPTIVPITDNGRTVPSVVTYLKTAKNQVLVGEPACQQEVEAGGAYRNVKRIIGTGGKLSKDIAEVVPFVKVSSSGKTFKKDSLLNRLHDAEVHATLLRDIRSSKEDECVSPELISCEILQYLKQHAEQHIASKITRAVIGVPAYFNDAQREATKTAAEMAGIQKVKLLREPEAAALAYGIDKEQIGLGDEDELVLVFDLGGGTFDVSVLAVGGGLTEIISTGGNPQLGGSDFDARIAQHFFKLFREHDNNLVINKWSDEEKSAVVQAAECTRIYLSNNKKANLALPLSEEAWRNLMTPSSVLLPIDYDFAEGGSNSTHIMFQLTRNEMENLCKDEFQALLRPVREVAIMSGALLPGDSSPAIVEAALELEEEEQGMVSAKFGKFYSDNTEPSSAGSTISDSGPDLLLQIQEQDTRAAKKAQQRGRKRARDVAKQERKFREEKRKLEESPRSIRSSNADSVKVRDGIAGRPISRVVLVGGATRMPGIGRLIAALTGVVPQKTVNPDEAVALGCAVHAGILDGEEGMGTVLNPMQAAILRAVAADRGLDNDFEDDEFDSMDYY